MAKSNNSESLIRRVPSIDRIMVLVLTIAVVVVGFTSIQNTKNYRQFTECTVEYLSQDRLASKTTTQSSRELVSANNEANRTIPALLGTVLELGATESPTQAQLQQAVDRIKDTNEAFTESNKKYNDYVETVKNNPRPPDPTTFCKEHHD